MMEEKTILQKLYDDIEKMFVVNRNKIATQCSPKGIRERGVCKARMRLRAYEMAIEIVKKNFNKCKNDKWNGETKCREKFAKVIRVYNRKIAQHKQEHKAWLKSLTRTPHANSAIPSVDPITQHILEQQMPKQCARYKKLSKKYEKTGKRHTKLTSNIAGRALVAGKASLMRSGHGDVSQCLTYKRIKFNKLADLCVLQYKVKAAEAADNTKMIPALRAQINELSRELIAHENNYAREVKGAC